ncbi:MAG: helix-turn-helix domain-containing protein [Microthrixaceae bacterium]
MSGPSPLELRSARHAALGDPVRLAIIDELATSDRTPVELRQQFALESNLLAHHLDVLDAAGLIQRTRSSGDGRRRYVHLRHPALADLHVGPTTVAGPALFVCTLNSARSTCRRSLAPSHRRGPRRLAPTPPRSSTPAPSPPPAAPASTSPEQSPRPSTTWMSPRSL